MQTGDIVFRQPLNALEKMFLALLLCHSNECGLFYIFS